jgi:hypothetical protein
MLLWTAWSPHVAVQEVWQSVLLAKTSTNVKQKTKQLSSVSGRRASTTVEVETVHSVQFGAGP